MQYRERCHSLRRRQPDHRYNRIIRTRISYCSSFQDRRKLIFSLSLYHSDPWNRRGSGDRGEDRGRFGRGRFWRQGTVLETGDGSLSPFHVKRRQRTVPCLRTVPFSIFFRSRCFSGRMFCCDQSRFTYSFLLKYGEYFPQNGCSRVLHRGRDLKLAGLAGLPFVTGNHVSIRSIQSIKIRNDRYAFCGRKRNTHR